MSLLSGLGNVLQVTKIAVAKVANTLSLGAAGAISPTVKELAQTKIVANVSNPVLKSTAEFIANNPATTALIATPRVISNIPKLISKASTTTKVVGAIVAPSVAIGAATNPSKALLTVSMATPESIVNYTQKAYDVKSVQGVTDLIKSNPVISGAIAAGTVAVAGKALTSAYSSYLNVSNVKATQENTKALTSYIPLKPQAINAPVAAAPVAAAPVAAEPVAAEPITTKKKAKKKTTKKKAKKKTTKKKAKKKTTKKKAKKKTTKKKTAKKKKNLNTKKKK